MAIDPTGAVVAVKTWFGLLVLICFGFAATAQDMSDPIRYFNGRAITLNPVFTWWSNASAIVKSNTHLSKARQRVVPPRVMPAWVRITTSEITNTGGGNWIARARIQESPGGGMETMLIRLQHGPTMELTKFQAAAAEHAGATDARERARMTSESQRERADSLHARATSYSAMDQAVPGLGFRSAAQNYSQAAGQANRNANQAFTRMESLDSRRAYLETITQGRTLMTIDSFALRTGQSYAGLPIYDLGLSPVR